jgi:hypothetical protein
MIGQKSRHSRIRRSEQSASEIQTLTNSSVGAIGQRIHSPSPGLEVVRARPNRGNRRVWVITFLRWQGSAHGDLGRELDCRFLQCQLGSEPSIDDYSKPDPALAKMIKDDGAPATALGYRALLDRGFSTKNPPADFRMALAKIVQETIAFWCEQFVDAGIPVEKLYPHVAAPAPIELMNAPIWTAFNRYSRPGWTTYAVEVLGQSFKAIYDELEKHGNPPWAGVEANAGMPGSVVDWETYLAWHYNHGCVLVGVNMGATGEDLPRRLWESAFSKEAIAAYHKFLMGQPLVEKSVSIDHPQFRIQAKIKRVAAGIARWHGSGKDPSAVGKLMQGVQPLADAGKLVELEKLVDQALEMLGETVH